MVTIVSDEKIKVFIRVRPIMRSEVGKEIIVFTDKSSPSLVRVSDHSHYHESTFNKVFDQKSTQREIFDSI